MDTFGPATTAEQVTADLDLRGRTYLLTGCSSGLGHEAMRVLALRGARVIGTARTHAKAAAACAQIDGDTVPLACELSDLASVRNAVALIQEPLHGIIANAGVMALQELTLHHGVEAQLFINHVAHFLLVTGLIDRLAPDGRVVMVSSAAHLFTKPEGLQFDDLKWDQPYRPWTAYGQSKLANILFARVLAERLSDGQTANAVHPGVIDTPLWRHLPQATADRMRAEMSFKTIPQGAATAVFVATHPAVSSTSGAYFADCAVTEESTLARDAGLAERLWRSTEALAASL